MGKTENMKEKKYLMDDDYMLYKVLDKIKNIIGIEKFDDTKILVDIDYKLPDDIALKNIVVLMKCVMKDADKF